MRLRDASISACSRVRLASSVASRKMRAAPSSARILICDALSRAVCRTCNVSSPSRRATVSSSSRSGAVDGARLGGAELALELDLTISEPSELGRDPAQQLAHLVLVVPAARGRELRLGDGRGRRRVGSRDRDGHGPSVGTQGGSLVAIGTASIGVAAQLLERRQGLVDGGDRDDPQSVAPGEPRPLDVLLALCRRHEEHVDTGLGHRRRLLAQPADGADRSVELDRPGDGDVLAAGELTGRQLVDQRQREGQPGGRATDARRCRCRARTATRRVACRTGGSRRSCAPDRRVPTSARP